MGRRTGGRESAFEDGGGGVEVGVEVAGAAGRRSHPGCQRAIDVLRFES
jgi:hypothetical protein